MRTRSFCRLEFGHQEGVGHNGVVDGAQRPTPPTSPEADCEIWWRYAHDVTERDASYLSSDERHRAESIAEDQARARFIAGAALIRLVVAARTGIAALDVVVRRSCSTCSSRSHGRPWLPDVPISVSLSHSGDLVGVALSSAGPVGLDIERIVRLDYNAIKRLVLDWDEKADNIEDFFRVWTRKESAVKATGDGITIGLVRVRTTHPDEPPAIIRYAGRPDLAATMLDLSPLRGYVGAVTILDARPSVKVRDSWF